MISDEYITPALIRNLSNGARIRIDRMYTNILFNPEQPLCLFYQLYKTYAYITIST